MSTPKINPAIPLFVLILTAPTASVLAGEPAALNPFGAVQTERDDVFPGYIEMNDGQVFVGNVYMTRDKRVKVYDKQMERQREIPLRAIKEIDAQVTKEFEEKEWKYKEMASDERMYTGRSYPVREYSHKVIMKTGNKTIEGGLSEVFFVDPIKDPKKPNAPVAEGETKRLILHKRDKGEMGDKLKSLRYVKVVKLGEDALEEGYRKAAKYKPPAAKTKKTESKEADGKEPEEADK